MSQYPLESFEKREIARNEGNFLSSSPAFQLTFSRARTFTIGMLFAVAKSPQFDVVDVRVVKGIGIRWREDGQIKCVHVF